MPRRAFFSFHYAIDHWRASQVRQMGMIEGNRPAHDNDWEAIKRGGDSEIIRWIDAQLSGTSVAIVLIGEQTAGRKWITHEIKTAWERSKGVLGVHVHGLKDSQGKQSCRGRNPFDFLTVGGKSMSTIARTYDSPYSTSDYVYGYIRDNLPSWIEDAIAIRGQYG